MRVLLFAIMAAFLCGGVASAQQYHRPNPCPPGADYCRVVERESVRERGGYLPQQHYGQGGGYNYRQDGVSVCILCGNGRAQARPAPQPYVMYPPVQSRGYGYQSYAPAPQQCALGEWQTMTQYGPACQGCPQGTTPMRHPQTGRMTCRVG